MSLLRWTSVAGACVLVAAACSDTEFQPSKPLTDAGADGAAGSGGGDAAVACTKNADCDDLKACNGTETCDGNFCKAGTPFCADPDPANCDVTCTEGANGPTCATAAKDSDGDTHGTKLCTAAPGDDCDDTDKNVYPGATETCDGVDSDCDGLPDIDDGFGLGGAEAEVVSAGDPEWPHAAWVSKLKSWGVVWQDTREAAGNEEIFFAVLDHGGKKLGQDVRISNAAGASLAPRIAWGHDSFAIAWQDDKSGNDEIYVQLVDSGGAKKGPETKITNSPADNFAVDIVATAGGFVVAYTENSTNTSEVYAQLLTKAGAKDGVEKLQSSTGKNLGARTALLGTDIALAYVTAPASPSAPTAADAVVVTRVSQFLDPTGTDTVSPTPPPRKVELYLGVAATQSGYGVLYSLAGAGKKHAYVERKADGSSVCGPVELPDVVETTPSISWVSSLVSTKNGPLGLALDGVSTGKLLLLRPGCSPKSAVPLTSGAVGGPFGALSVGDGKILALWGDKVGQNVVLKSRVFGEELCN